ncbi:hypothetical protein VE04_03778 [Pseudogymnoascus sp. 24MN13]|nr:hypothetical protein VE04_03778 [Pseudogymnoascus sp. 24MN13]
MTQTGCSAWLTKLHWRTLILTLALLTVVNFVFLNDTLRGAYSTRQGQQSLTDPKTRIETEDWEVVTDPLMLLGKAGIQELAGIQEVELTEAQLRKAGLQELEVTRTQLVLNMPILDDSNTHFYIPGNSADDKDECLSICVAVRDQYADLTEVAHTPLPPPRHPTLYPMDDGSSPVLAVGTRSSCGWSDRWQLYINSVTSALMVMMLAFLANIRERHSNYTTECLETIYKVDAALELKLRTVTGDRVENEPVHITVPERSRIQREIDYYADLVGTLIGIAFLFFVLAVWVAIGPALSFDSTWWLLIGTYAGLIGMNDGFVRNVYNILHGYEDAEFAQVTYDDMSMLAVIGVMQLNEERVADNSFSCRISVKMGDFCSHELTVVFGAYHLRQCDGLDRHWTATL